MRVAWIVPLALLACSRGDGPPAASAEPTVSVSIERGPVHFTTPSKNIGCYLTAESVVCDVGDYTGRLPPRPAECEHDWVAGASIDSNGVTLGRCTSDTALGASRVLAHGTSVQVGDIRCASDRDGLICRDGGGTSGGFLLNRTGMGEFD